MIDVTQAVKAASRHAQERYGPKETIDLRLEEVELSKDDRYWLVTLGLIPSLARAAGGTVGEDDREYKLIRVDARTGRVLSMEIRSAA